MSTQTPTFRRVYPNALYRVTRATPPLRKDQVIHVYEMDLARNNRKRNIVYRWGDERRKIPSASLRALPEPCTCAAYPFPHRPGSGHCSDPGPEPRNCDACRYARLVREPFDVFGAPLVTECGLSACPWEPHDFRIELPDPEDLP